MRKVDRGEKIECKSREIKQTKKVERLNRERNKIRKWRQKIERRLRDKRKEKTVRK